VTLANEQTQQPGALLPENKYAADQHDEHGELAEVPPVESM
jgi:hypothetical protein